MRFAQLEEKAQEAVQLSAEVAQAAEDRKDLDGQLDASELEVAQLLAVHDEQIGKLTSQLEAEAAKVAAAETRLAEVQEAATKVK